MMLYLIAQDGVDKLNVLLKKLPNRTKEEHADVKMLADLIESIEQNPHEDPDDE